MLADKMEVSVTIHQRETFSLTVESSTLLEEFKSMIHIKADVPVSAQHLSGPRGTLREDRQPVSYYGLQAGDSVTVHIDLELNSPRQYTVETLRTQISIQARPYDLVRAVKDRLKERGCGEVRLSCNGEELENHHTLAYYQVEELLALEDQEFPLCVESASRTKCQLVANSGSTVALILSRAIEKCRVDYSEVRLVHNTAVLQPEATLASLYLATPATLYLDKPFNVYVVCSSKSSFYVAVHFFDTVAMLKTSITHAYKKLSSAGHLRLFWEMKELLDEERVGRTLPYESATVSVLKPQEVLVRIQDFYHSAHYLAIGPEESVATLLKRNELSSSRLVALVHNSCTLEESQPLRLLGVNHGDDLQGIANYTIQMLDKRKFTCRVVVPAKGKPLKHIIKRQEQLPLKQQTLYLMQSATHLSEVLSDRYLDSPHTKVLLLLPGQVVLTIRSSDASTITVAASLSDTVAGLKQRVQEATKLPGLQLYLGEQLLDEALSLSSLPDKPQLSLFTKDEVLLKVHDSAGAVVDFLVRGNKSIGEIKREMRCDGRFWFRYQPTGHLHLFCDEKELPDELFIRESGILPHQHVKAVLEGERLLTIHMCAREPVVGLYPCTDTIRTLKESFAYYSVDSSMRRLDDLYLNHQLLADTATLECVPPKCELEYLNQEENYLVYVRELDGKVVRVGVTESDQSVLALKRKWAYRNPHRPSSVKLLHQGKVLKDAYSLKGIEPWCQFDLLVRTDWLVWIKPADRPSFTVGIRPSQTVRDLKTMIQAVYSYSEPMRLVAGTTLLLEESTVSHTVLRNGGTVLLHDSRSTLVFVNSHFGSAAAFVQLPSTPISRLKVLIERKLLYRRKYVQLTHTKKEVQDSQSLADFPHSDFLPFELSLERLAK